MALRSISAVALTAALVTTSACSLTQSNDEAKSASGPVRVTSTESRCEVSTTALEAGPAVFKVKNSGSQVTEFYVYASDGKAILGEIENVGPALTRDLVVQLPPGEYVTACKPGMKGAGLRGKLTVTGSAGAVTITGVTPAAIKTATGQYAAYVKDQSAQLLQATQKFVAAYKSGNDDLARTLFPQAREHYEGIEPVAESFGDLDPETDLREADLEKGQKWTGWHRIEKDLWPPATGYRSLDEAGRATYADNLLKNITTLDRRVQTLTYTVDQIGNGSKGLLDEVATSKITGEEDIWSHTDLWDFQANVDGARVGYENLKPLLEVKAPALSATIGARFTALQKLLDTYRRGDGFVFYDAVTPAQRKQLSDAVNALSEPLSKMTGALVQ